MYLKKFLVLLILLITVYQGYSKALDLVLQEVQNDFYMDHELGSIKSCELATNPYIQLLAFNIVIAFIVWRNMEGGE
ncbi:hypothetical protein HHI36_010974 [Cryptolaemus montrouzieri]|uniref:Uncharacterized protein n=1 Tax=Cryptolaemus montrouzieri TaxID=559131 RepID=A0ABD2MKC8_9CUCU